MGTYVFDSKRERELVSVTLLPPSYRICKNCFKINKNKPSIALALAGIGNILYLCVTFL